VYFEAGDDDAGVLLVDGDELEVEFLPAHLEALGNGDIEVGNGVLEDSDKLFERDFLGAGVHFGDCVGRGVLLPTRMLMNF
jgi:hypothetical protein